MKIDDILSTIAEAQNISVDEVKRDIQEAINAAYIDPNSMAKHIPSKGDVPTIDEFVAFAINRIK